MNKIIFVLAFLGCSYSFAQDRLEPLSSSTAIDGYFADLKKYLLPDGIPLYMAEPANMAEWSLCWDQKNRQLVSRKATSIIWTYRIYGERERRSAELDPEPTIERHALDIDWKMGYLIQSLITDAVNNAMFPPQDRMVLDGCVYMFFGDNKQAEINLYEPGGKCEELISVMNAVNNAVVKEDASALSSLTQRIHNLITAFRKCYPEDLFEPRYSMRRTVSDEKYHQCAIAQFLNLRLHWRDDVMKNSSREEIKASEERAEKRRTAFMKKYGKSLRQLVKQHFVNQEYIDTDGSVTIYVSGKADAVPTLLKYSYTKYQFILPEKDVTPKKLEQYLKEMKSTEDESMYIYDKGWKLQPYEAYRTMEYNLVTSSTW